MKENMDTNIFKKLYELNLTCNKYELKTQAKHEKNFNFFIIR